MNKLNKTSLFALVIFASQGNINAAPIVENSSASPAKPPRTFRHQLPAQGNSLQREPGSTQAGDSLEALKKKMIEMQMANSRALPPEQIRKRAQAKTAQHLPLSHSSTTLSDMFERCALKTEPQADSASPALPTEGGRSAPPSQLTATPVIKTGAGDATSAHADDSRSDPFIRRVAEVAHKPGYEYTAATVSAAVIEPSAIDEDLAPPLLDKDDTPSRAITAVPSSAAPGYLSPTRSAAYPPAALAVYAANLATANTLFATGFDHRSTGAATNNDDQQQAIWLRIAGSHNHVRLGDGQLHSRTTSQSVQLGQELLHWQSPDQQGLHLGVMLGAGRSQTRSQRSHEGERANGGIQGYTSGIYATWYEQERHREGLYLDGSLNWNWFGNHVSDHSSRTEDSYRSRGWVSALETGYIHRLYQSADYSLFLQPQLQLSWLGVRSYLDQQAHKLATATRGQGNLRMRLGSRIYWQPGEYLTVPHQWQGRPFIDVFMIKDSHRYGAQTADWSLQQDGTRQLAEVVLGYDGKLTDNVDLWLNAGHKVGAAGFHESLATVGASVKF